MKHRNSSKWAKHALRRGAHLLDASTKSAVNEQLRLGQELKQKVGHLAVKLCSTCACILLGTLVVLSNPTVHLTGYLLARQTGEYLLKQKVGPLTGYLLGRAAIALGACMTKPMVQELKQKVDFEALQDLGKLPALLVLCKHFQISL